MTIGNCEFYSLAAMNSNPITKAIDLVGLQPLASACGVTYQAVRKWERTRAPSERCREIEAATGGKVTRYELRPDVFGETPSCPCQSEHAA